MRHPGGRAVCRLGPHPVEARGDREYWGRLAESSIGSHLANAAGAGSCERFYWRDNVAEVDFVVRSGRSIVPIEVQSGDSRDGHAGLAEFVRRFKTRRQLLVGGDRVSTEAFLARPVSDWVRSGG